MLTPTRPALLRPGETDLWPEELDDYNAVLATPYDELTADHLCVVVECGYLFLPPDHLRYFLPALARHAADVAAQSGEYEMEELVAAFVKARPHELGPGMVDGLRAAATARVLSPAEIAGRHEKPDLWFPPPQKELNDWREPNGAAPGHAKLLVLLADLDGASTEQVALMSSMHDAVATSVIEHDWCVLHAGWRPDNPLAAPLYKEAAIRERQHRIAGHPDPLIARCAARILAYPALAGAPMG